MCVCKCIWLIVVVWNSDYGVESMVVNLLENIVYY